MSLLRPSHAARAQLDEAAEPGGRGRGEPGDEERAKRREAQAFGAVGSP